VQTVNQKARRSGLHKQGGKDIISQGRRGEKNVRRKSNGGKRLPSLTGDRDRKSGVRVKLVQETQGAQESKVMKQ